MKNKSFGLIVNRNAGKVQSGVYKRKQFEDIFGDQGLIRETKSVEEISLVLKEFQDAEIDILFIYGGDGTHKHVISQILRSKITFPFVAPLKGGTMNQLAKDTKLGGSSTKTVYKILNLYSSMNKKIPYFEKPILKVSLNSKESTYGFYFANGMIYNILKRYYESPSSVSNAVKVTVGGLLGSLIPSHSYSKLLDPISCDVNFDGNNLQQNQFLGIMMSTLDRVVFGLTPFMKKRKNNNEFHFIGYSFPKKKLICYFPLLARGKMVHNLKIYPMTLTNLILKCDSGFTLDGEVYDLNEPTKIKIEVGGFINIPIIDQ